MGNDRYVYEKMDKANRAKQFMPFDALTGLREALREKEKIHEVKKDLSEEQKMELDYRLQSVNVQDEISVDYYDNESYKNIVGKVKKIDFTGKYLVVDEINISFNNIYDLQLR